jgi:hypothetical protein
MLKLLQPGIQPLGQFDGLDSDVLTLKGGEVVSFTYVTTPGQPGVAATGFDQAAYDAFDGYVNVSGTTPKRVAVTRRWDGTYLPVDGYTAISGVSTGRPLFLSDDGILGYGTLFGEVVGGTVGQVSYGPNSSVPAVNLLGPHTSTGSGKTTCWDKPGLYAVSLDAVDTSSTGLVPTNTSATLAGTALGFTGSTGAGTGGLLTPSGSTNDCTHGLVKVGYLVEFNTNGALVTTPNYLVAALNSPSGIVSSSGPRQFQFATIYFAPGNY